MARSAIPSKRNIKSGSKVKTGCMTCRIRKVKCDESKPSCQKCVKTGRTCDGYESPFRVCVGKHVDDSHAGGPKSHVGSGPVLPTVLAITPQDIDLLNHCFSTKTILDVKLGCDEEARQILQASLTDLPIRHAIWSLQALREDLEISGDNPTSIVRQSPSYRYGLQQYNMALGGLASNLSVLGEDGLRSALLCCQMFISIEQVQKNYATMAQHIIRGFKIMHEYRARPSFVAPKKLLPACHDHLPLVDVFVIKLFAAPCKFAEPAVSANISEVALAQCPVLSQQQFSGSSDIRLIAPNMRVQLTRIAGLTLEFLSKVSQVESTETAMQLLHEKAALLLSLESWLNGLENLQKEIKPCDPEPIMVAFSRFFHLILKTVLLGALDSSPYARAELQAENDRLQSAANNVGERVKAYTMYKGTGNERGQRFTKR